jgi:hypothetical protein
MAGAASVQSPQPPAWYGFPVQSSSWWQVRGVGCVRVWASGEKESGVAGERNFLSPCLCVSRERRRIVSFKTTLFWFFFFNACTVNKTHLRNNPKKGYDNRDHPLSFTLIHTSYYNVGS